MTLGEAIERLGEFNREHTIYAAEPWTVDSEANVQQDPRSTAPLDGLAYLLDVYTALDVIEVWSEHRDGARPTVAERCAALVYYANHDAYLIPEE
ncbi:DUF7716 domain-containing protein [Kribbella speibonae]|uniref:DUF7716 domain-containing protein n=1 Tax=Kribbella speibonae TaxID=1572660 RepID=UPI0013F3DED6|nr:hypothetical protein [Kribbella speibonae]